MLQVTRAGFYQWLHKPMSDRAIEDLRLLALIRASCIASGGVYRSPRVLGDLREAGETCGKYRVARIMRSVRAQDRGMVHETDAGARAGPGCAADGAVATQAPT